MTEVLLNPLPNNKKELAFALLRVPFFLEPHADESKPFVCTNRQRLLEKWGGSAGWEAQKRRHDLKGRGLAAGIPYFNLDRLVGNTMASHRLIQMIGKLYGLRVSEQVYDLLNDYYFVQGHSLNDQPRLAHAVAERLPQLVALDEPSTAPVLSAKDLLAFLESNQGRAEIVAALAAQDELNIHSIPKFIVEGSTVVDGAATADVFVHIFRDIERRGTVTAGPLFASLLGIATTLEPSHTRDQIRAG